MRTGRIQTIRLGGNAVYLASGRKGYLMIDGGHRWFNRWFFTRLKQAGIPPQQIRLVVVTHVHFDHVGTLAAVKARCRCAVAVHTREAELLAAGRVVIPPGTNWMGKAVKRFTDHHPGATSRFCAFKPVEPDIRVSAAVSLDRLGFDACIVPTPGHTAGSLSVLTGTGSAFVGDLAVNMPLLATPRHAAPFGDNPAEMANSIQRLIRAGAKRIYPAHGQPFSAYEWQPAANGETAGCRRPS